MTPAGVSPSDIAIVGGGVIGAACARAAAQRGLHVTLFAPEPDPGAASVASAGLLAAQIEAPDRRLLPLAVRGRDLYADLAASLEDTTGTNIGFQLIGIATLAFDDTQAQALWELVAEQRQAGLRCDWLDRADLDERWPGVAPDARGALYAPEDGCLDPAALTRALLADALRLGVRVSRETVQRLLITNGRVMGVASGSTSTPVAQIVIAAGAWSPLLDGLPRPLLVEPVRGQIMTIDWPAGFPAGAFYHGHGYMLPRGQEAILGSTMERAGFDARITEPGLDEIRRSTARLCPAIAESPLRRNWAGLRPVTPDGLPILGADPDVTGLWYATGHGRNGILLAGITGEIIADLLAQGSTDMDITELAIDRFAQDQPMSDTR